MVPTLRCGRELAAEVDQGWGLRRQLGRAVATVRGKCSTTTSLISHGRSPPVGVRSNMLKRRGTSPSTKARELAR